VWRRRLAIQLLRDENRTISPHASSRLIGHFFRHRFIQESRVRTLAGRVTMEVILHVHATRIRKTAAPPPTALLSSCENGKRTASRMVPLQAEECKKSRLAERGKDLSY
jgi:hypothetical protein